MPTVQFFGRNGADFQKIGSIRFLNGQLQMEGDQEVLQRILEREYTALGGEDTIVGMDDPEAFLAAAPKMFNGSAFYAKAVADEDNSDASGGRLRNSGSDSTDKNGSRNDTINSGKSAVDSETSAVSERPKSDSPSKAPSNAQNSTNPLPGSKEQQSYEPDTQQRGPLARRTNQVVPGSEDTPNSDKQVRDIVTDPKTPLPAPPLPEMPGTTPRERRKVAGALEPAAEPIREGLDPEGKPMGWVAMQAVPCPQCGADLQFSTTHVYCQTPPCEYQQELAEVIPGFEEYQRLDLELQQLKDVSTLPTNWTGDRCATCKHFAVHPDEEVGFCTARHMQLNTARQQWCSAFKEGVFTDALWTEIDRILPMDAPELSKLPAVIGRLESGTEVVLYDGKVVMLAKRRQPSNRGYDEKGHMDTVLGSSTVADPDMYRAVWGKPRPADSPEQIYADATQTPRFTQRMTLAHEGIELPLMQAGMDYDTAHNYANPAEQERREQEQ